ncbi:NmrA-like domain-containing protein [Lipomyces doorenjongii]|uniref:NmrA-like domain-containing protein n=1 Tax=Lipomyces doorenjongii TaxID=383834 RepID=UPI0034CF6872
MRRTTIEIQGADIRPGGSQHLDRNRPGGLIRKFLSFFGTTGLQGGSVIESILGDPQAAAQFSIRAVTRDPSKASAQDLIANGVECVAADMDDTGSLRSALMGAYAVFVVTNFWEKLNADAEIQQGKNVADISNELDIKHLVWSSLLNSPMENWINVFHFDSKAPVEEYIRQIGIPASFFLPGFYMSNIPGRSMRLNLDTKELRFGRPVPGTSPIPLPDTAADTDKFVKRMLLNREKGMSATLQEEMLQNMQLMPEFGYYGTNL